MIIATVQYVCDRCHKTEIWTHDVDLYGEISFGKPDGWMHVSRYYDEGYLMDGKWTYSFRPNLFVCPECYAHHNDILTTKKFREERQEQQEG